MHKMLKKDSKVSETFLLFCDSCAFSRLQLSKFCTRPAGLVTLTAKDAAAHLWLKRHLVVLAAMVANYLKTLRRVTALAGFFRAASGAPLRRHHVPLIENFLFLLGEKKSFFVLDARCFNVRHCRFSLSILR